MNAGTVEYLYSVEDNKFYFLELNPRLQVEHPVTEMITSTNLPAAQLQVAMGIPLDRIPSIRRLYGKDPFGESRIDFDVAEQNPPEGHVIAARITAENPNEGFQPTSGQIQDLNFRSSRHVWGYFSVDSSGRVHEFADSQIGHIFSWGHNRDEARQNLALALNDISIRGEIRTTVEYLKDLLESDDYVSNKFDTGWLDKRIKRQIKTVRLSPHQVVYVGSACEAHAVFKSRKEAYISALERGQTPSRSLLRITLLNQVIYENVKYHVQILQTGAATFSVICNGHRYEVEVRSLADGGYLVLMRGKSSVVYTKEEVGAFVIDGQTCLFRRVRPYQAARKHGWQTSKVSRRERRLGAQGHSLRRGRGNEDEYAPSRPNREF